MEFRGGEVKLTPPIISWFSSTPAGIGLKDYILSRRLNNCTLQEMSFFLISTRLYSFCFCWVTLYNFKKSNEDKRQQLYAHCTQTHFLNKLIFKLLLSLFALKQHGIRMRFLKYRLLLFESTKLIFFQSFYYTMMLLL